MISARGGVRKPVSHALGCFRSLVVRVLRQVCCHLRFGCDCSPALWSQPMILGGFDAFLLRCVRWYAEHCAFGCCVERGRRMSAFDCCARCLQVCMTVPGHFSGAV